MKSSFHLSAVALLLILCALGSVVASDSAGTTTAASTLFDSTSMIASSLAAAQSGITASLSVEAASATSLVGSTSAASSYADSTTSATSSMHSATTSASSTIADSTTSAASSLGEPTTASLGGGSGSSSSSSSSTSGAVVTMPSPCGNSGQGSGCQDPHFVGFDGSVYDFHGRRDAVFTLITDSMLEVNALFSEYTDGWTKKVKWGSAKTWMTEIGVRCFNHSVIISSPRKTTILVSNSEDSAMRADISPSGSSVDIRCGSYWALTVSSEHDRSSNGYSLRLHNTVLSLPAHPPHGILGQTLRYRYTGDQLPHPVRGHGDQGKGVVEGKVDDYVVRDGILGDDSNVNRFQANVTELEFRESKRSESETSFRKTASAFYQ